MRLVKGDDFISRCLEPRKASSATEPVTEAAPASAPPLTEAAEVTTTAAPQDSPKDMEVATQEAGSEEACSSSGEYFDALATFNC